MYPVAPQLSDGSRPYARRRSIALPQFRDILDRDPEWLGAEPYGVASVTGKFPADE
jgi:hypothetical protein